MMSSRAFDPPVFKDTYTSGLKSSTHSNKGDRIRCCGLPCWLQILFIAVLLVLLVSVGLYLYQKKTGKTVDLRPSYDPDSKNNRRLNLLRHYELDPLIECPTNYVLNNSRC